MNSVMSMDEVISITNNFLVEEFEVELKKMIIQQSSSIIQEQMHKVVEQFEGTQLTAVQCKD